MSPDAEAENRALNAAEIEMVKGARPPAIEQQTKEELKALAHRLRQAHSRAHDISARQQREIRGKAEPHGARRAQDYAGSVAKTQALFEAIPRLERPAHSPLPVIGGRPPDLAALPAGCSFAPRCRGAQDDCRRAAPPLAEHEPGHRWACWHPCENVADAFGEPGRPVPPGNRDTA